MPPSRMRRMRPPIRRCPATWVDSDDDAPITDEELEAEALAAAATPEGTPDLILRAVDGGGWQAPAPEDARRRAGRAG